jgi:hypothetical protein
MRRYASRPPLSEHIPPLYRIQGVSKRDVEHVIFGLAVLAKTIEESNRTRHLCSHCSMAAITEEERGEGKQRESFCPPTWRVHHNFSDDGYSEYASIALSKQDFHTWSKKNSFLVIVFSALLIMLSKLWT